MTSEQIILRLRRALQKIADLPLRDHPRNAGRANTRVRARRIAVGALKSTSSDKRGMGE